MALRSKRLFQKVFRFSAAFVVLLVASAAAFGARPDEQALLTLWNTQASDPGNDAAIIHAVEGFEAGFPKSPLIGVSRGLSAWHQLKAGNIDDARRLLGLMSTGGTDPISAAGREMALRWLTRLDMKAVQKGLLKVFADNIEFPDTLAPVGNLPPDVRPPMTDRWGAPWTYNTKEFKVIKAGSNHHYVLQSTKLGNMSDFEKAIAFPYAGSALKIDKILVAEPGKAVVQVSGVGVSNSVLSEGASAGNISFPYFGEAIVVLSDGDHWAVLPKP